MRPAATRRNPGDERAPRDPYQEVTDRIIAALEQGVVPWRRPWNPARAGQDARPRNASTGRRYSGINLVLLAMSPFAWSTGDNRWCSYKQAQARGWQVRRGEHGTTVFFFKRLAVKDERAAPEGEGEERFIPLLRAYTIFHASQIDGIPGATAPVPQEVTWRCPEAVDVILRHSGAVIRFGGAQAFYCPATDHIQLPPLETFPSPESFAAVALHELAHWSGTKSRLDRDLSGKFGTPAYAEEELRAELASVFMGAELGLPSDIPNHASYLQSWLRKLRDDKREIFRAAAAAQRIADYCLGFHPDHRRDAPVTEEEGETREAA